MNQGQSTGRLSITLNRSERIRVDLPTQHAFLSDSEVDAKWAEYRDRYVEETAAAREFHTAADKLSWWAKPGPEFLQCDGTMTGRIVDWPAIKDMAPPRRPGLVRQIRPSPTSLEECWTNPGAGPDGERHLHAALAQLDARRADQRAEEQRLGLPAMNRAIDQLSEARFQAKWKVYDLPPVTPIIVAAQLLVDCIEAVLPNEIPAKSADVEMAIQRLRAVIPYLSGRVAVDTVIFLDSIERPFSSEGYDIVAAGN